MEFYHGFQNIWGGIRVSDHKNVKLFFYGMVQLLCSLHFVLKGSVTNTVGYFICSGFPNNRVLLQSIGCHEASVTPFDLTGRGTLGGEGLALPSNQGVSC